MRPQTSSTSDIRSSVVARSLLAIRSAIAWTTLPKPWLVELTTSPPASRCRNHCAGQVSSPSRALADRVSGSAAGRTGWSERLGARSPHQEAGSALAATGSIVDVGLGEPPEPPGGRGAQRLGLLGVGEGTADLGDQAGHRERAGRSADPVLGVATELVDEPRRLLAVVVGRGDRRDQQPLAGAGAGDVEQPALLGQHRGPGQRRAAARRGRSGRPGATCPVGAGRARCPPGRGRRRPAATRGPWSDAR